MRLATANKELKLKYNKIHNLSAFFLFAWGILDGVVSAHFISLPLLPPAAVFWCSILYRSRASCLCTFCTCSNSPSPREHWTVLVLNGWRWWWWGAARSRQGLVSFVSEARAVVSVVSAHALVLLRGTMPGPGLVDARLGDIALWNDQCLCRCGPVTSAHRDSSVLIIACDL